MNNTIFDPGTVVIEIKSTDKDTAIEEIISHARVFDDLSDRKLFTKSVLAREKLESTGVGHGVAFAHGKLPEISRTRVALGISREGIEFGSFDGRPVHLLFVVATHPDMHIDYLNCLAALARMARNEDFREEILSCCREEDVQDKLVTSYRRAVGLAAAS